MAIFHVKYHFATGGDFIDQIEATDATAAIRTLLRRLPEAKIVWSKTEASSGYKFERLDDGPRHG
jgi:hypothetical protein